MKTLVMALALAAAGLGAAGAASAKDNPMVVLDTSEGKITMELYPAKAPVTVDNFLWYVNHGFYDGLTFHRIVPGFVIQGGGFEPDMSQKPTNPSIDNEAGNGLSNEKYTVAMARTNAVNSATSQFFINLKDNGALDHRDNTVAGFGYCVFGKVVDGEDTVNAIAGVPTTTKNGMQGVPKTPVIIKEAYQIDKDGKKMPKTLKKTTGEKSK